MKISLRKISSFFFRNHSKILQEINSNALMREWLIINPSPFLFNYREELYKYINNVYFNCESIDYLEFGVAQGASIKAWLNLNNKRESRFFGFDTFEGLPESFELIRARFPKGTFTNQGKYPKIDDIRLSLIKGLFQETLPKFLSSYVKTNHLIIHNDSDLYSSSLYLLTRLNEILKPGSIIIFDEFSCSSHEFQAFYDYCKSYKRSYEVVAATCYDNKTYTQIAIKIN